MGLTHPADLEAWRRWQESGNPLRAIKARLRPAGPASGVLTLGGERPTLLVAIDSTSPSNVASLLAPLEHLDPTTVAVLSPGEVGALLPDGPWASRAWTAGDPLPEVGAVMSAGHYLALGAASYDLARERAVPFLVSQHGLLTPLAPPLPPDARLLAWSQSDADFWRSGRTDVVTHVVGSALLWQAAQGARADAIDPLAPPTYLGQLHGAELPRKELVAAAEAFCRTTGASYRPHPSERDRASRRQHLLWERAGIHVDHTGGPLAEVTTPVVSVFSTGVLEAAARGIPAWVDFPRPPIWLAEFWTRYRMSPWGSAPTPFPVPSGAPPARLVADLIGDLT